jgi:hypothetical protein
MAKKTYGHMLDSKGKPVVVDMTPTRAQKKSTKSAIPWTPGPGTSKLKRAARALWG